MLWHILLSSPPIELPQHSVFSCGGCYCAESCSPISIVAELHIGGQRTKNILLINHEFVLYAVYGCYCVADFIVRPPMKFGSEEIA